MPNLNGLYIFGDFMSGWVSAFIHRHAFTPGCRLWKLQHYHDIKENEDKIVSLNSVELLILRLCSSLHLCISSSVGA